MVDNVQISSTKMVEEERRSLTNSDKIMLERMKRYAMINQRYLLSKPVVAHSLVVIFGISAWIGINGIYVQLPLLVISAPEGWNLPAYVVLTIQMANAGPLLYTLVKKLRSSLDESLCIFALLFLGSSAMILLIFFYDETLYIDGERRSIPMLILIFLNALVGCTSSVLFMPYLRNSSEKYLVSYFVGEGLSGVLPGVVAFFQGVGGNPECRVNENNTLVEIISDPRFSPRPYFVFLSAILLSSFFTFGFLRYLPSIEKENFNEKQRRDEDGNIFRTNNVVKNRCNDNPDTSRSVEFFDKEEMTSFRTIYLHILVAIVCLLGNGFLPSVQTYSCLPYGNVAFHLTVTLANIANPLACLFFLRFDSIDWKVINTLSFVGTVTSVYVIYIAANSPNPLLRDSIIGVAVIIFVWILLTSVISYLKLSITSKIRQKFGPEALVRIGIIMQAGSACGAILSFGLVNYTNIFQQHETCVTL